MTFGVPKNLRSPRSSRFGILTSNSSPPKLYVFSVPLLSVKLVGNMIFMRTKLKIDLFVPLPKSKAVLTWIRKYLSMSSIEKVTVLRLLSKAMKTSLQATCIGASPTTEAVPSNFTPLNLPPKNVLLDGSSFVFANWSCSSNECNAAIWASSFKRKKSKYLVGSATIVSRISCWSFHVMVVKSSTMISKLGSLGSM